MALPRGTDAWEALATRAVAAFVRERGAVLWPELEAHLSEGGWIHDHLDPSFPPNRGPDPHHLHTARGNLELRGVLVPDAAILQGLRITAWLDGHALQSRKKTQTIRLAGAKRRLYRRYLTWTTTKRLCGAIAERIVHESLLELRGRHLWLPDDLRPGEVRSLLGQPVETGGPLDAAGHVAKDPNNPDSGFVPFAVEIKNLRSAMYPWDHEVWDLLAKVADFPTVVPILVGRRLHSTTFKFFKDVGALGMAMRNHWFSDRINEHEFNEITAALGFHDAVRVPEPIRPHPLVRSFFRSTVHAETPEGPLIEAAAARWERAAPIAEYHADLRHSTLEPSERSRLWFQFARDVVAEGLYERRGWAPEGTEEVEEEDADIPPDWYEPF